MGVLKGSVESMGGDTECYDSLISLLARGPGDGPIGACLAALRDGPREYRVNRGVPVSRALLVYSDRAEVDRRRQDDRAGAIAGFDRLLPRLAETPARDVAVHTLTGPRETFVVFTDPDVTDLLGILLIPAGVEAQRETMAARAA